MGLILVRSYVVTSVDDLRGTRGVKWPRIYLLRRLVAVGERRLFGGLLQWSNDCILCPPRISFVLLRYCLTCSVGRDPDLSPDSPVEPIRQCDHLTNR